jgi:hypothetical protein
MVQKSQENIRRYKEIESREVLSNVRLEFKCFIIRVVVNEWLANLVM